MLLPSGLVSTLIRIAAWVGARTCFDNNDLPSPSLIAPTVRLAFDYEMIRAHLQLLLFVRTRPLLTLVTKYLMFGSNYVIDERTNLRLMLLSLILESSGGHDVCELCLITNFAQSSAQNIVFKARHWRQPCRLSAWQTRLGRRSLQGLIMYPLVERFGQVEVEEDREVALWANWSHSGRL